MDTEVTVGDGVARSPEDEDMFKAGSKRGRIEIRTARNKILLSNMKEFLCKMRLDLIYAQRYHTPLTFL